MFVGSPDESLIKNWIQHLNRATTALWNIRYNESQIKNRPLPRLPVAPIAPLRRDDLRRTLARPNVFDTAVALNEAIEEYAELDSSMRNLHIVPSVDTMLSRSDSLRSEDRAQRRYGVFEVDSIVSADEPDESHETEINYSENHSSCYQTSAHTSIVHSDSDFSDASEADKEMPRYEHPELWKYLNRIGNETNRLNGALDLALVSPLPEATANTVSTAIIGYAAYLLEINKMTRPLATNSTTEAIDQLTNEYYKFSNRLLVGMVSNPTDEDQECNAQWELEWEVYELGSIAKDTATELLKLMALL